MAIFTTTTRAYWRESQEPHACVQCKAEGVPTFQTGHKPRREKHIQWWPQYHICQPCKDNLPDTPPPP